MTIYTPIPPTYLYIKQHSITGLKYFGKTTKKDPYKYNGSGTHWTRHIKTHGREHVVTLWVSELYQDTSIIEHALQFSIENNIVESNAWANLILENGLDGRIKGIKLSVDHVAKLSAAKIGIKLSADHVANMSAALKGKPKPAGHGAKVSAAKMGKKQPKISAALTGKKHSAETKAKMSAAKMGKPREKQPIITCPHCHVSGGERAMKRYHFDNCKKRRPKPPLDVYSVSSKD